jgi:hypothetical protein
MDNCFVVTQSKSQGLANRQVEAAHVHIERMRKSHGCLQPILIKMFNS